MPPGKRRAAALLPSAKDLAALTPQKIQMVMEAIDRDGDRDLRYASLSLVCGVICLVANMVLFGYLVMNNHEKAAGVVFGTTILGLIGKIVLARL